MIGNDLLGDVSLYIHIPFCSKKCPYCHFFVLPDKHALKEQFLASLFQEWKLRAPLLQGKRVVSIYFGGGTPSRLTALQISTILSYIRKDAHIASDCEITLEVNPEDASKEFFISLKEMGINRISFGIQSLDDAQLITLDRQHSSHQGIDALDLAYSAGISNLSIDLMYDLPHQTLFSWERTLERVSALPITHLSLYNLTLEPHTVFFKKQAEIKPYLPNPDLSFSLLDTAVARLSSLGLERYEISAFAKAGCHSRHNTGYWTARSFLGLGPSAFSYWEKKRFRNMAHLNRYSESLTQGQFPVDFEEKLGFYEQQKELFAVQLRLVQGVDLIRFEQRHGPLGLDLMKSIDCLVAKEWIDRRGSWVKLTSQGQLFYDSAASELI
ncbi:MAG: radical SAM family heme chaperone HemW [Rhabdochlamydiaceae bacterium]|nr:radical SAM family heme chaperone HemW [Rhabdochlamydiaceae bacterium]